MLEDEMGTPSAGGVGSRAMRGRSGGRAGRRGFTLIELLVAIAIILLLIGIFVPVLAAARRNARKSDTINQLSSLRSACESYFQMFQSYPGTIGEELLVADYGYTGSHNLTLGTVGTLYRAQWPKTPQTTPQVYSGVWGTLPLPPTPAPANSKIYEVYAAEAPLGIFDPNSGRWHASFYAPRGGMELVKVQGAKAPANPLPQTSIQQHSAIPVYHDRFSSPLPILYFRRDPAVNNPVVSNVTTPASGAYYRLSNAPYYDSTTLKSQDGTVISQATSGYGSSNIGVGVPAGFTSHLEYTLTDMTAESGNASTRRARGGFALISAGEDRIYGPVINNGQKVSESDDVVVFGGH